MKKIVSFILSLILLSSTALLFTACDAKYLDAAGASLDGMGFTTLLSSDEFFALAKTFSLDGKTLDTYLTYDYSTAHGGGKTNLDDTLKMASESVPEANGKYQKTYQYLVTYRDLAGLTLPEEIRIGESLVSVLDKLTGNHDCLEDFEPTREALYEMNVCENKEGARIILRDMKRATDTSGYRFQYQVLYTDTARVMTDEGSVLLTRTLIFSFDNDAEGNPLKMIEITLEARHKI